ENITFRAKTPAFSVSTATEDAIHEGELVYIPAELGESELDLWHVADLDESVGVAGKIVVTEGFAMPAQVKYFEEKGALGAIFVNPGKNIHDGICTPIWGSPDLDNYEQEPNIIATAVNKADGEEIIKLCKQGKVTVSLETK